MEGGSILSEIARHIRGMKMAIKGIRTNLKPSVRKILKQYGNIPITDIFVCRQPIKHHIPDLIKAINFLTNHNVPVYHDTLYHLYLLCKLENGKIISLEKNEDINMSVYDIKDGEDFMHVPSEIKTTLDTLIANTLTYLGPEKFYTYTATQYNCQHFVFSVLTANDIPISEELQHFIMQDVGNVVNEHVKNYANTLVEIYNRAKTFVVGEGINTKIVII